jgi:hypothetical protein
MYDADDIPPDPHAAEAIALAEWRLAMLQELTEIGMTLARDLGRQVAEPPAPDKAAPRRDPADSFARLSRAIRLTINLHARIAAELAALRAGVAIEIETRRKDVAARVKAAAQKKSADYRKRIQDAVEVAVDAEIDDDEARFDCMWALEERLEHDEAYEDLESLTFTEAVQRLCADLDLSPDWSRWTEEGWQRDPGQVRPPGSEFCKPSRKPILDVSDAYAQTFRPSG